MFNINYIKYNLKYFNNNNNNNFKLYAVVIAEQCFKLLIKIIIKNKWNTRTNLEIFGLKVK